MHQVPRRLVYVHILLSSSHLVQPLRDYLCAVASPTAAGGRRGQWLGVVPPGPTIRLRFDVSSAQAAFIFRQYVFHNTLQYLAYVFHGSPP